MNAEINQGLLFPFLQHIRPPNLLARKRTPKGHFSRSAFSIPTSSDSMTRMSMSVRLSYTLSLNQKKSPWSMNPSFSAITANYPVKGSVPMIIISILKKSNRLKWIQFIKQDKGLTQIELLTVDQVAIFVLYTPIGVLSPSWTNEANPVGGFWFWPNP